MDEFSSCMLSNTRMAARAITRRYDAAARRHGITAVQFSLLGTLLELGEMTVSDLAERRAFERTTLTRNLDRLEAQGFVVSRAAEHGNGRYCRLTEAGRDVVEALKPDWRRAQQEVRDLLGTENFDTAITLLKAISRL